MRRKRIRNPQLAAWDVLKGKELAMMVSIGTSMGSQETVCKATFVEVLISSRSIPSVGVKDIKLPSVDSSYTYATKLRYLGINPRRKGLPVSYRSARLSTALKTHSIELLAIGGTKLGNIYGPDLRKWPLYALQMKFSRFMWGRYNKDIKLQKLVLDSQNNVTTFLHALSLCRTATVHTEDFMTDREKCIKGLFKF